MSSYRGGIQKNEIFSFRKVLQQLFKESLVLDRAKRFSPLLLEPLILTEEEMMFFEDQHNIYRRMQNASNMRLMVWDPQLAAFASSYVQ